MAVPLLALLGRAVASGGARAATRGIGLRTLKGNAPDVSGLSNIGGSIKGKVSVDMTEINALFDRMSNVPNEADQALQQFALDVADSAKLRVPVDTGKLKWSIRALRNGDGTYEVSADAPYAAFVELGTRHQRAQPYLRPAINVHKPRLLKRLAKIAEASK